VTDDKKPVDITLRRIQQRKAKGEQPYSDPLLQAADEISTLYGRLATRMPTKDLLVALYLAERALYTVLRQAIGEVHTNEIRTQAVEQACTQYSMAWPEHERRGTVFDKPDSDDEPPKPTG